MTSASGPSLGPAGPPPGGAPRPAGLVRLLPGRRPPRLGGVRQHRPGLGHCRPGWRGPRPRLTARELVRLLDALAGPDPARAHRAVWQLVDSPRDSVPMLKALLENAPSAEDRRIFRLINQLGSPRENVAKVAAAELRELGTRAESALHQGVREHPEPAVRRRARSLLARLEGPLRPTLPTGDVIALRALEVLEKVGSPEARRVIGRTARGEGGPRVTREAKAALNRLARKK